MKFLKRLFGIKEGGSIECDHNWSIWYPTQYGFEVHMVRVCTKCWNYETESNVPKVFVKIDQLKEVIKQVKEKQQL